MQVTSKQSFELGYNKACALLAQGDFAAAETELRLAIKLGGCRGRGVQGEGRVGEGVWGCSKRM